MIITTNDLQIEYETNNKPTCQYINRLNANLNNNEYNIDIIANLLNTIIDNTVNELNDIHKKVKENIHNIDKLSDLKDVIKIAKILSNDFNLFIKINDDYNQIKSIEINGADNIKVNELMSLINNHKKILYELLKDISNTYAQLFNDCNNKYNNMDNESKNLILKFSKNISDVLYKNQLKDSIEIQNEGLGTIPGTILNGILVRIGRGLFALPGILYHILYDPIFGNLGENSFFSKLFDMIASVFKISTDLASTIVTTGIVFLGVCLVLWLYGKIRDTRNTNLNHPLNQKINKINYDIKNGNNKDIISTVTSPLSNSPINDKPKINDNIFRGFGNTVGYKPTENNSKENDKYGIF